MKKLLYILPVLFLATSCDKDDTESGTSKTQIISQTAWKFENAGVDIDRNGTIELDISNQLEACARDNTYKFEADGSGTVNEGATRCNASSPQTTPFSWAFMSGETELRITSNPAQLFSGQYKIMTLNNTKMTLSKDTTVSGMSATLIANFIH